MNSKKGVMIISIFIMLAGFSVIAPNSAHDLTLQKGHIMQTIDRTQYVTHDIITINSNSEFETYAAINNWNGSGTASDPYHISEYDITSNDTANHAIYIGNTTLYFTIENSYFHGFGRSLIILYNTTNGIIQNDSFEGPSAMGGITLIKSFSIIVNNCTFNGFYDPSSYSIYTQNSYDNIIENCTSISSATHFIIYESHNNTIINNTLKDNFYSGPGIKIENSQYNVVENNTIYPMGGQNIYLYNSTHNIIKNNTIQITYYIYQAHKYGIYLLNSDENLIFGNHIIGYTTYTPNYLAIYIQNSTYNNISYNSMRNSGIFLIGNKKTFTTQTMYNNTVNGKMVYYLKNTNNTNGYVFTNAGQYIVGNVSNISLGNLFINNISAGVEVGYSNNISFSNITIKDMQYGIYIVNSSNISIKNSKLTDDIGSTGTEKLLNEIIHVSKSSYISISNVTAIGGHNCLSLNFVNDSTLQNMNLDISSDATTYLIQWHHSTNTIIYNNTLKHSYHAIYLDSVVNVSVKNNKFLFTQTSINIKNTSSLNISENYFYKGGWGIYTKSTNSYTIAHNIFSNISYYAIYAIYNPVKGNLIKNNTFSSCSVGIYVLHSNNYRIYGNILSNSPNTAIYLKNTTGNTLKYNKLVKNKIGILLQGSQNNSLLNNTITSGNTGIDVENSGTNVIKNNTISKLTFGIEIVSSNAIKIYSNNMTKTGIFIKGNITTFVSQEIPINNTVNGLPVLYIINKTLNNASLIQVTSIKPGEIILGNVTGLRIENYNISKTTVSIEMGFAEYITLINNQISYDNVWGIYTYHTNFVNLTNNSYYNNTGYGSYFIYSNHTKVISNWYCNNSKDGVHFIYANNTDVINNHFYRNKATAIYFKHEKNGTISNNTAINNNYGMWLDYFSSNLISKNNLSNNNDDGMYMAISSHNKIIDNIISNNNVGSDIENSNNILLEYNKINDNAWEGEVIKSSTYFTLKNNSINNNGWTNLYIFESHHITIKNNSLNSAGFSEGIELYSSSNITIDGNTISHNKDSGIYDYNSSYILIANNTIYHNKYNGIFIYSTSNITVYSNKISSTYSYGYYGDQGNGLEAEHTSLLKILNNTFSNNIESGIYLYYSRNNDICDNHFASNKWSAVYMQKSTNNILTNNTFQGDYLSITLRDSSYNLIRNNTMFNFSYGGVELSTGSSNNHILNNTIAYNKYVFFPSKGGIIISKGANYNSIIGNTIADIDNYGIFVQGEGELIQENKVLSNKIGIGIQSNYTIIFLNTITNNKKYGVAILSGNNNTIFNNTFICNNGSNGKFSDDHIQAYDNGSDNSWSFMKTGNYWIDWADNNNTNDLNPHNGIVDWPYKIAGAANATDKFPLKNFPVGSPPTSPTNFSGHAGNGFVFIKWGPPICMGTGNVTGYKVYRNGKLLATLASTQLNFNDTNVTNGVSYTYFIIPINSAGAGAPTQALTFTPITVPNAPQLSVNGGNRYVNLTWDSPSSDGGSSITEYKIYRNGVFLVSVPASRHWYNDTSVINGQTYTYYITAVNSAGESPASNKVSVTPSGPVPEFSSIIIWAEAILLALIILRRH